jgi:hypothetical protein
MAQQDQILVIHQLILIQTHLSYHDVVVTEVEELLEMFRGLAMVELEVVERRSK